jgi:hypothetical protein
LFTTFSPDDYTRNAREINEKHVVIVELSSLFKVVEDRNYAEGESWPG